MEGGSVGDGMRIWRGRFLKGWEEVLLGRVRINFLQL